MAISEKVKANYTVRKLLAFCEEKGWKPEHHFEVAYVGWEMDNDVVVARDANNNWHMVGTSHGSPCKMTQEELDQIIARTSEWLSQQIIARVLMRGP